jgi:hypothetical protein
LECNFKLEKYPFDYQSCFIDVSTFWKKKFRFKKICSCNCFLSILDCIAIRFRRICEHYLQRTKLYRPRCSYAGNLSIKYHHQKLDVS